MLWRPEDTTCCEQGARYPTTNRDFLHIFFRHCSQQNLVLSLFLRGLVDSSTISSGPYLRHQKLGASTLSCTFGLSSAFKFAAHVRHRNIFWLRWIEAVTFHNWFEEAAMVPQVPWGARLQASQCCLPSCVVLICKENFGASDPRFLWSADQHPPAEPADRLPKACLLSLRSWFLIMIFVLLRFCSRLLAHESTDIVDASLTGPDSKLCEPQTRAPVERPNKRWDFASAHQSTVIINIVFFVARRQRVGLRRTASSTLRRHRCRRFTYPPSP
jgi:hypothetical protein